MTLLDHATPRVLRAVAAGAVSGLVERGGHALTLRVWECPVGSAEPPRGGRQYGIME